MTDRRTDGVTDTVSSWEALASKNCEQQFWTTITCSHILLLALWYLILNRDGLKWSEISMGPDTIKITSNMWTQSRGTGHRLVWPVSQIMWLVPEHSIIWDRSQIKKCSCFQVKSALVVLILEEKICIGIIWDWSPDSRGINMTTTPWK